MPASEFLPVSKSDLDKRGWDCCDFIFVSGDAYVDHPSFAAALIGRVLEAGGYRVGIIPQPDWKNSDSYLLLGFPRLAFLVGAGSMDSMVAHYTAAKKPRSKDAYSPGGKAGLRPDRAILKYSGGIREAVKKACLENSGRKNVPVIIGGVEAGLRRFAHYDYWSDTVRRSILLDSKADILVYGMGESAILEIAARLNAGENINDINDVRGTCMRGRHTAAGVVELPGFEAVRGGDPVSRNAYVRHFLIQKNNSDPQSAKILAEENDGGRCVIQNPPAFPVEQKELDRIYELPFTRRSHPVYDAAGGIPALKEVSFSLVSGRGCFGGCSFCSISLHQGRAVRGRSLESLVREAQKLVTMPGFKGYIHDVGGPTANFFGPACAKQKKGGFCVHRDCLYPSPCPELKADHGPYLEALRALRSIDGVKKVFIRSGIRYDFINADKNGDEFLEELCAHHVSGQLKVAPEHNSPKVLSLMRKTGEYDSFRKKFIQMNLKLGLKQFLIPYYMTGHPGAAREDAEGLAACLKKSGFVPEQTQDFYPTPGTMSTVMYYTGLDPLTMETIYVPKGNEKTMQKNLLTNALSKKSLMQNSLIIKNSPTHLSSGR